MKKVLLLLVFSTLLFTSFAQNFTKIFLGEDYQQYKGLTFKLNKSQIGGFSFSFYKNLSSAKENNSNAVAYPETKYHFNTTKDSLLNKTFVVNDIIGDDNSYRAKVIFMLEETTSKEILYFKYDSKYEHSFPFLVAGYKIDENDIKEKIVRIEDDMENKVTITSPYLMPLQIVKVIEKGKRATYLSLRTNGFTLNSGTRGVIVLFTDGTKWTKTNEKISVDVGGKDWEYSAFITMTPTDIATFSKKKIAKFRLYIYDEVIDQVEADKFTMFVSTISKMK